MNFEISPFDKSKHYREGFDCGVPELNNYLLQQASQDIRKHAATLYVATKPNENKVVGYYTLSPTGEDTQNFPEGVRKKLPRYSQVPAILLGRLAVDKTMQGQGLGARLMSNAIIRGLELPLTWATMIVDAKDDTACAFYRKYGFEPLMGNDSKHLYVQRTDLERVVAKERSFVTPQEEVKILVSAEIKKQWEAVAKAKGLTLEHYLINLANDDTRKPFAEQELSQNKEGKDEKEHQSGTNFLKNRREYGR